MNPFRPPEAFSDVPWGRLACDTDESWLAFVAYRDGRPPRRLRSVCCAPVLDVQRWYIEHGWRERVSAYDAHLDTVMREERETVLRQKTQEIAAEHMAVLANARQICDLEISRILETTRNCKGPNVVMKTGELIKLMELVIKMERLVRDQTTENLGTGIDLSKLTDEELEEYQRLLKKTDGDLPV